MGARILNHVLLFVVGLIVGTIGTAAQQSAATILGITVPWGVIVSLLAVACLLAGLRLVNDSRWYAFATALGIVIPVAVLATPSPGGSVLIPANATGYVWIFGPVIIAVIALAWPAARRQPVPENA